jgi:hypothetical protein|tara:strand:+ start:109 stop:324 length:216 start_codon:yes stop_codon:yes gene_type:complete
MKKIKNNYTNFILTVIAVAMIGLLFKGEIIKPAYASSVEYVCVLDRVFVVKGDSIAQLWTYSNNRGSKPKH